MPFLVAITAAAIALSAAAPAEAMRPPSREQDQAFRGTQTGRFVPLRLIEARIVPQMRGFDYLGPELDARASRYRLKFLRGHKVVWIDVDARTGQITGKFGL